MEVSPADDNMKSMNHRRISATCSLKSLDINQSGNDYISLGRCTDQTRTSSEKREDDIERALPAEGERERANKLLIARMTACQY